MSARDEQQCERFRETASLLLDGEDGALESAAHRAHAARCPACRAYAAQLRKVSAVLRGARLERPLRRIGVVTRRRRDGVDRGATLVAVLVALAAGLAGVRAGDDPGSPAVAPRSAPAGTAPRMM